MEIFLNELSFCGQAPCRDTGKALMQNLLNTLKILCGISKNPVATSNVLWEKEIAPHYTVKGYIYDKSVNQAEKGIFQAIVTKGPYIETFFNQSSSEHKCYLVNDSSVDVSMTSIVAAFFFDGVLASLKGAPNYENEIVIVSCCEQNAGQQEVSLGNLFDPDMAESFISDYLQQNTNSWEELWKNRTALFPEIVFCEDVKEQLRKIDFSPSVYRNITRHLTVMNGYIGKVKSVEITTPNYKQMGIDASEESEITLRHYGHERIFKCSDGNERLFSWHSKLKSKANLRIHFYPPDKQTNDFIIGYIGRYLHFWTEN